MFSSVFNSVSRSTPSNVLSVLCSNPTRVQLCVQLHIAFYSVQCSTLYRVQILLVFSSLFNSVSRSTPSNVLLCIVVGAGRSSEVERSLMVRWVVGSIIHGVDPLSYFSFQPVLHDWCNKGRGMCYPVCGMVHIKEPLLLIGKSSPCGGSGFPLPYGPLPYV